MTRASPAARPSPNQRTSVSGAPVRQPVSRVPFPDLKPAEAVTAANDLERRGELDAAAELLEPHLAEPLDPDVAYRLASVRIKQDRLDDARSLLQGALRSRYEDPRIHTNLGVLYDAQGRTEEAIRAFRRAIQLAPREATAHLNLGALYGELGRYDDAVRSLSRCVELRPDFEGWFNLAMVRFRQGEFAEVERLLARALHEDPKHAVAHYYLGRCRYKRGLTAEAVDSFSTALRHQPELVRARVYLGMALNKLGRYGAAVKELTRVATVLADDGRVHYQLGIAYDGLSLKSEARDAYRRARTLAR